jgi:hypothetical protein
MERRRFLVVTRAMKVPRERERVMKIAMGLSVY